MSVPTVWLACGVLRAEMQELLRLGKIRGDLMYLDSMLHMDPPKLDAMLTAALGRFASEGKRVVLVYGDCCPRMLDIVRQYRVGRVGAVNCAQMLVGRTRYRELMQEQAFMLLPEWTSRWKEVFRTELGLTKAVAHDLMREHRKTLVYLDTQLVPVPHEALAECAAYTGLPVRVEQVSLDPLLKMLLEAETPPFRSTEEQPS